MRRKVVATVVTKGGVVVAAAVSSIVISRALQPEGRGSYYVLVAIAGMTLTLGHLSLEHAHTYLWSTDVDRRTLVANATTLAVVTGAAAALVAGTIVLVLGPDVVPIPSTALLWVSLASVPIATLVLFSNSFAYLRGEIRLVNVGAATAAVAQTLVLLCLAAVHALSVATVIWVWVAATAIPLVVLVPALRPSLRAVNAGVARQALALGLKYHLGMVALTLLYRLDALLLNGMSTRTQVGLYSLAVTLAEMIYLVTDSVAQVILPRQYADDLAAARRYTARFVGMNLVLAVITFGFVALVSPVAVPLLYGGDFRGSVGPLLALGPGVVALATARPVGAFLLRLNRPWVVTWMCLAALAVNVVANILLIPHLGAAGAAFASSIAYVALAVAYLTWLRHGSDVRWADLLPSRADVAAPVVALRGRRRQRA